MRSGRSCSVVLQTILENPDTLLKVMRPEEHFAIDPSILLDYQQRAVFEGANAPTPKRDALNFRTMRENAMNIFQYPNDPYQRLSRFLGALGKVYSMASIKGGRDGNISGSLQDPLTNFKQILAKKIRDIEKLLSKIRQGPEVWHCVCVCVCVCVCAGVGVWVSGCVCKACQVIPSSTSVLFSPIQMNWCYDTNILFIEHYTFLSHAVF